MKDPRWQALQKKAQKNQAEWPATVQQEDEEAKTEIAKNKEKFINENRQ